MITADTITDEQIRELRDSVKRETAMLFSNTHASGRSDRLWVVSQEYYSARVALKERRAKRGDSHAKARARCAEILNARAVKP